jgi:Secretion system C-terminal sorting domain
VMLSFFMAGYSQSARKSGSTAKTGSLQLRNAGFVPINPAAVIFTDNMDGDNSLSGLGLRGYSTYGRSIGPVDTTGMGVGPIWFQGDPLAFSSYNGPANGYVASDYLSVGDSSGFEEIIDNWLVLPAQSVAAGDSFSFWASAISASTFADSIRVLFNSTGATLPEDTNWVEVDNLFVDPATGWARHAYAIPTTSSTATLAIRYNVIDAGPAGANSEYIGIDQIDVFDNAVVVAGSFDTCANAVNINSAFGGAIGTVNTMGPYDNSTATTNGDDPLLGWSCFGEPDGGGAAPELNNTVWFTFTGDGNNYLIKSNTSCAGVTDPLEDGDTQFALYSGACGSLTPLKCNEDIGTTGPPYPAGVTFGTQVGTTYYLMVDGFNFLGAISDGEFCLEISRTATVNCNDASVTAGTASQNRTFLCEGDTVTLLSVSTVGAVAPTTGDYSGIGWIISSSDLTGNSNAVTDPSVVAWYTFNNPVPSTSTRTFRNNGQISAIAPGNTYYWTPIVFGNAVQFSAGAPVFLNDLTLDPTCTTTGTSLGVDILLANDPLCISSVSENLPGKKTNIIAYPSPAQDLLRIDFTSSVKGNKVIEVSDFTGRVVMSASHKANNGVNTIELNVKSLSSGSYFVTIKGDVGRTVKFIKK